MIIEKGKGVETDFVFITDQHHAAILRQSNATDIMENWNLTAIALASRKHVRATRHTLLAFSCPYYTLHLDASEETSCTVNYEMLTNYLFLDLSASPFS